jgi:hypothetical protein
MMDDRIYTLATRAWMTEQGSNRDPIIPREFIDKFAELIVRECAGLVDHVRMEDGTTRGEFIRKHFGVAE